jgi:uncharacterized protein (DUF983 family)
MHSCFTPVTCDQCKSKLRFDKVDWYKKVSWVLLPCALLIGADLFVHPAIWLGLTLLILAVIGLIKFLLDLRHIKLQVKERQIV